MEFGVTGIALDWVRSYLTDRRQFMKLGRHCSDTVKCSSGVPQGSVLGPLFFAVYVSPVGDLIKSHGVEHHQYADDTQLFLSMQASSMTSKNLHKHESRSQAVKAWFAENELLLNADKSDVMLIGTSAQLRAANGITNIAVAGASLKPTAELKSLGVIIDSRLTFAAHVSAVCKACNYHLWALRHIRHLLTTDVTNTLACSIVGSRLDYCNSVLYGAPTSTMKLQRLQNSIARVVLQQPRWVHAEPLLQSLHWLPIKQRIEYKLAVLTYKVRATSTPKYLDDLISNRVTGTRMSLRSASRALLTVPFTRTVCASRAFRVCAPIVWSRLPADLQFCDCFKTFKNFKTFLYIAALSTFVTNRSQSASESSDFTAL